MRIARKNGFTLIEILIVIAIIAVLMAIAIPNMMKARDASQRKACLSNLREISQAKEQYAMEHGKKEHDAVVWSVIVPDYLKVVPICPLGGEYTIGAIGVDPACPNPDHALP